MITLIISMLISLGVITSEADYNNASEVQQIQYQEIVIDDMVEL